MGLFLQILLHRFSAMALLVTKWIIMYCDIILRILRDISNPRWPWSLDVINLDQASWNVFYQHWLLNWASRKPSPLLHEKWWLAQLKWFLAQRNLMTYDSTWCNSFFPTLSCSVSVLIIKTFFSCVFFTLKNWKTVLLLHNVQNIGQRFQ